MNEAIQQRTKWKTETVFEEKENIQLKSCGHVRMVDTHGSMAFTSKEEDQENLDEGCRKGRGLMKRSIINVEIIEAAALDYALKVLFAMT